MNADERMAQIQKSAARDPSYGNFLDSEKNPLEIGAMYCCCEERTDYGAQPEETYTNYGMLVRYAGNGDFLDADTLEECEADYDFLVRQQAPVIEL